MCRYRAVYTRDMKKYKLTKESIEWCGKTLFRIEAVAAFGTVAKGEKGGFIENEENLSQDNDAWVYDNAQVSGNARVSDNAWVSDNAQVYGDRLIFWASKVGRDNGTLTVFNSEDNTLTVTRGCFIGSIDEFLAKSEIEHDDATHIEYRLLIEVAYSRISRAQKE